MPDECREALSHIDSIRAFAEDSSIAIAVLDGPAHRVVYMNPAFVEATGQPPHTLLHRPAAEAFPALYAGGHLVPLDVVRATGGPCLADARAIPLGGPGRLWDAEASAVREPDGTIRGVLVQMRDVTAGQARLRQAETDAAVLDAVFEHLPVGLALATGPDVRLIRVSRHGLGPAGRDSLAMLTGGTTTRHGDEAPRPPEELPLVRVLHHGEAVLRHHWVVRDDQGETRTMRFSAAPVRDAAGRIACGILNWDELAAPGSPDEARYQALVEAGALAVWTTGPDGVLKHLDGWRTLTGQSDAEAAGMGWLDAVHPEDRAMVRDRWLAAIASGSVYDVEYRIHCGRYRWTAARAVPLRDPEGKVIQWIGVNTDIDARKQAELALRHSEARFRTLAEAMPHLVWQTDTHGEPNYVNPRWQMVTGLDLAGLRGGGWLAALHPEDRPALATAWMQVLREGGEYDADARIRGTNGLYRWYRVKAAPVRDAAGTIRHWVGTCTDIDERHIAEVRLRDALAAGESLARAADHRIKNSLQLVASLLRLQGGRVTEPAAREALEAATARVQAVAEAHRALQLSPDLRNIRLSDMLRELAVGATVHHPAADIRIAAPDMLILDAERAIPLALILSELVTNALRHAHPDNRPGPVRLSARLEGGTILAEVADGGTGLPEGATASLGDTVIRALAKQIMAEMVTQSSPATGTRVTLRLAAEPPAEAATPRSPRPEVVAQPSLAAHRLR